MKECTKDKMYLIALVAVIMVLFAIFILNYEDAEGVPKPRILRTNDPIVIDQEFQRVYDELQRLTTWVQACGCDTL